MKDPKSIRLDQTIGSITPEKLEETRRHVAAESGRKHEVVSVEVAVAGVAEEEDARIKKLDIITDVQLILVEKYRRAATLMWVAIGLLALCGLGLGVGALIGLDVQERLIALAKEQQQMLEEQQEAKKAAEEAKKQAAETKREISETKKKVDEAVEASPKIEIDDQGKAKVVVPVKKAEPEPKPEQKTPKAPPKPMPKPAGVKMDEAPLPQNVPIELR